MYIYALAIMRRANFLESTYSSAEENVTPHYRPTNNDLKDLNIEAYSSFRLCTNGCLLFYLFTFFFKRVFNEAFVICINTRLKSRVNKWSKNISYCTEIWVVKNNFSKQILCVHQQSHLLTHANRFLNIQQNK